MGEKPEIIRKIGTLPHLKTLQVLSAGVDRILPYLPARITLCNARGAHTPATAEWTAGAIIASLRDFPRFAAAQLAGHWDWGQSESVAGKRVLIVGYGSIGEAVERRLASWWKSRSTASRMPRGVAQWRTGRAAADPNADVVIIILPVAEGRTNWSTPVPEDHEGRRAARERRQGSHRRH